MASRQSETHEIAFLEQDNGELQEDVVAKERPRADDDRSSANGALDEEVAESFPASDPPSHWSGVDGDAGTPRPEQDRDRDRAGRVVGRAPLDDVPERGHPTDPVPGTLPTPPDPATPGGGA